MANQNSVGWFEIQVTNIGKAVQFYQTVFAQKLEKIDDPTGETQMMSFPADMSSYGAAGALVQSTLSRPGGGGTTVYFEVKDCAVEVSRVANAGGKVIRPKFSIGNFGWAALCEDPEGNVFGLHSMS
jgi:uncharacterized protein